jgi:predicted phosphohydrolase
MADLKLQYASDLHIEFPQNREFLKSHYLQPAGEILILAGDIVPFAVIDKHKDFFSYLSDNFKMTYWLPGNHEYYHFDIAEKSGEVNEKIRSNLFLVNNISKVHENTKMIFSTLWSKISPGHQWQIERSLNDFRLIKFNGYRFSADKFNRLHEECLTFIEKELNETLTENTVVISHHCPTFLNYPEQYKGDLLNEAFAVELYDLIHSSKIDYWVFGHHHSNVPEFSIGNTKLVTNQLGYVQRNEHGQFETDKCFQFEIKK